MLQLTFIGVQSLYNVVFLRHSKMNQPHVRVHPLLFGLPFHAGHQSALRRISHVVQHYCRCGFDSQESACNADRRPGFDPWGGKIPWRREWQPTPVFLPGEFHGQRSLADYSPQGHKELDMTEYNTFHTVQYNLISYLFYI